jgi:hypothetical protein
MRKTPGACRRAKPVVLRENVAIRALVPIEMAPIEMAAETFRRWNFNRLRQQRDNKSLVLRAFPKLRVFEQSFRNFDEELSQIRSNWTYI